MLSSELDWKLTLLLLLPIGTTADGEHVVNEFLRSRHGDEFTIKTVSSRFMKCPNITQFIYYGVVKSFTHC